MFAIVEIAGKQFRVEQDMTLDVPFLNKESGDKLEFDRVLLLQDEKGAKIGQPLVKGAKISAKVLENGREKKIIVFKKKRRKGYQVSRGHRQNFSRIQIEKIVG